tara:strand:- start:458 stop:892 length:435 start_codon:yes stop_codon:yes gene_type:complete
MVMPPEDDAPQPLPGGEPDDSAESPYAPPVNEPDAKALNADIRISAEQRQLHTGLGVVVGMILAGVTWTVLALVSPISVRDWTAYQWGENTVNWIVALWLPGGFVYVPLARKLSAPGGEGVRGGLLFGLFLCPFLWSVAVSMFA